MSHNATEYVCLVHFDNHFPNAEAWRSKLYEFGLPHEAVSLSISPTGQPVVKFWEQDRPEALRILAKLDGMRVSPQF